MLLQDLQSKMFDHLKLQATMLGYQQQDPSMVTDFRVLSDYELIYNLGGCTMVVTDKQTYRIEAGQMILIPSFTNHRIDTPSNNPHTNYWVHFDMEDSVLSRQLIRALTEKWGGLTAWVGEDPLLIDCYQQMNQVKNQADHFSYHLCQSYFKQVFIYLLKKFDITLDACCAVEHPIHKQVIEYVYTNYRSIESVSTIAMANNISLTYCNNIFKQYFDTSPAKFILRLKLKQAEALLRGSDQPVNLISDYLSFSSQYHFSNAFKKQYGIAPSEYRKLQFQY